MKKTLLTLSAVSLLALAAPAFAAPPASGAAATPASTSAASTSPTTMHAPTHPAASAHQPALYTRVQTKLKADSLYNGPINGRRTDATIHAIRAFQTQNHLTSNGRLDRPTLRALGV